VTSKSGFTPLHIAAHYGNESIANLLLNRGADVNYSAKVRIATLRVNIRKEHNTGLTLNFSILSRVTGLKASSVNLKGGLNMREIIFVHFHTDVSLTAVKIKLLPPKVLLFF
jgi:ankyrin repeat protein